MQKLASILAILIISAYSQSCANLNKNDLIQVGIITFDNPSDSNSRVNCYYIGPLNIIRH
jgi:hypothetical protein